MTYWRFAEALEVDTREAVVRWWLHRRPSGSMPIPAGLVEDLQAARLALEEGLQRRLWDLVTMLAEPERTNLTNRVAELDSWHVLSEMATSNAQRDPATIEQGEADQDLIAALKERAHRRERLEHPHFPNKARRRLRDFVRGRGGLAAVLKDDDACWMLRFGALLCDLIDVDLGVREEPDPDEVRAELAKLSEGDTRRAANAVLADPLVGSDDRGRPAEAGLPRFTESAIRAVQKWTGHQLAPTIARATASSSGHDVPGPDIQLILDLLAYHAPSKSADAVADLIKKALPKKRK